MNALQKIFAQSLSNEAKLLACYLVSRRTDLPTCAECQEALNRSHAQVTRLFQELAYASIVEGYMTKYTLAVEDDTLHEYASYLTSIKESKPDPNARQECAPSMRSLCRRYTELHVRYTESECEYANYLFPFFRKMCRDFNVKVVSSAIDDFFIKGYWAEYKSPSRPLSRNDFIRFLKQICLGQK